ncbi:MAG: ATP-binding protein [Candidatus Omnitrophica bacterium]|nr:ATP-binding protein [Candidatus Omnitrophota bacterium]
MIVSIASGKGGTGKTTVATNLASVLGISCQLLDCDVEEPNAHLFLDPVINQENKVFTLVPKVDAEKCKLCGRCQEVCAYNAIAVFGKKHLVFSALCHGCGACQYFCPHKAISEEKKEIGIVQKGTKNHLEIITGKMKIGEAMAPPVIREVKKYIKKDFITIIDAPPGTSCPVIESVKGSDYSVLVTEPTPFGLNDLKLGVEVLRKLKIPFGVIINRFDLGNDKTIQYCENQDIDILMKIPFDREIARVYSKGSLIIDEIPSYRQKFLELWESIKIKARK